MKYFTPERWLRLQDTSNKETWTAAFAEWEQSVVEYEKAAQQLAKINPKLRSYLEAESLHDGIVLGYSPQGRENDNFILLVRPCWPGDQLVLLTYGLLAPPVVQMPVLPGEWCNAQMEWMYDEMTTKGDKPEFTHEILLANGMHLTLHFSDFAFNLLSGDAETLAKCVRKPMTSLQAAG